MALSHHQIEEQSGSYYEIGLQHGRSQADRMRYLLSAFGIDLATAWREDEFLSPLEKHLPHLAEEIHGIAAGSELSLREVCALSFLIDLGTATAGNQESRMGIACTGVAFASGPDGPVVGKTSDCVPGVQQEWLMQRIVRPTGGFAALIHSHIGTPNAEMGMNDQGLAIGISGVLSKATDSEGVGWQQDIRAILHACATTQQAIEMLRAIPIRRAGYAAVVGDPSGDVVVVEKVVNCVAVRKPQRNIVYEANIALCGEALPHVDPSWCGENGERRTALLHCLSGTWTDFSLGGMINLFRTHQQPVGICQHGPELHSHVGFFMLPASREVWIAHGHTCESIKPDAVQLFRGLLR